MDALREHRLRGLVDLVDVRALLAVDLDVHEELVHQLRDRPDPRTTRAPSRGTNGTPNTRPTAGSACPCASPRRALPRPRDTSRPDCPRAAAGTGWFLSRGAVHHGELIRVTNASIIRVHLPRPRSRPQPCRTADRQAHEAEDERASREDDRAAGDASGRERLAEEAVAPEHAEDRHQQRDRDRLHRPHVGDQAVVEDECEGGREEREAQRREPRAARNRGEVARAPA